MKLEIQKYLILLYLLAQKTSCVQSFLICIMTWKPFLLYVMLVSTLQYHLHVMNHSKVQYKLKLSIPQ
uniref:Putative secreted protein n=1 Tax=Xenopsylla cheopis TaxID=163159 RepID=A0A6M2E0E2_XENCH